ncbi:MAG TPA: COX15/CtaA family protein [Gemmatimonadaceae bacterium]|jgi:cytochrome c oxidase assembly protein subunit 15|nr:COX15/CtaA family protein [Gemmatimonadaceae bacterium]
MTVLRRLAYTSLTLAFVQIVFGAIVRITGSGMGCGDHWPKCNGKWFPAHDRPDLAIEITHRHIAAALVLVIIVMLVTAFARRTTPGVGGRGGVLRPMGLAAGLVVTAAVFGGVTVKMGLNPYIIVTHLSIAMGLLAVLVVTVVRAGGFGIRALGGGIEGAFTGATAPQRPYEGPLDPTTYQRTYRATRVATAMAFLTLVLGALTANVAGANISCQGFPWCRTIAVHGMPLGIQMTHRILAFLLFFHVFGMAMAGRKRQISPVLKRATWIAFGTILLQIIVASMLVELHLPAVWRSLHQATGTLVWLAIVTLTVLARYAMLGGWGGAAGAEGAFTGALRSRSPSEGPLSASRDQPHPRRPDLA